jgi:hypothetical protein
MKPLVTKCVTIFSVTYILKNVSEAALCAVFR